jgi:hypothetical protein
VWAIDQPTVTAAETAKACARSIRDADLKQALLGAVPSLSSNSDLYQNNGVADRLHEANPAHYPVPGVSDEQMRKIYTRQLVSTRNGRRVYDALISSAPHGRCAYCQYGHATTLDHFVPKTPFGGLSIEPWNLIPCCSTCNHNLGSTWTGDPAKQMLHPYFVEDLGRWLYAAVVHQIPPTVTFFADPGPALSSVVARRIRYQFGELGLGELYSVVSGVDLSALDHLLREWRLGSEQAIRNYLFELAAAEFSRDPNDRRGVLYEALGNDDWFIAQYVAADVLK